MVPLRGCVPSAVSTILQRQPLTPAKVSFVWRIAVGPALDRVTTVTLTNDGTLRVTAVKPDWRRELERATDIILPRLREALGTEVVRRIQIR